MNTTQIAKDATGRILKRGDIVVSMQTARNLTFAYVTDSGDIATQEPGYLPVIHPAHRLHGVTVIDKEQVSMTPAKFTLSCVGKITQPRINHAIYYGNRQEAIAESKKVAKVLGPAGYHQFRLFEGDEFIAAFDVSTETTVIVVEARTKA